mmetsp:Transcript_23049/g.50540  ORF Transcript_23049/g.50540 Transcript_23049/m.50540 type:complete len:354 (-) Transcript_23049:55-1116(-)
MASFSCCVGGRVTVPRVAPLAGAASRRFVQVLKPVTRSTSLSSFQRPLGERRPQPQVWSRGNNQVIRASSEQSDVEATFNPDAAALMLDMLSNDSASTSAPSNLPSAALLPALVSGMLLIPAVPAEAALISAEGIPEWALNLFGFLYIAFFGFFVIRLFRKRAKFATSTKLATERDPKVNPADKYKQAVNPLDAFGGSLVAFAIAYFFYQGSTKIDASFAGKSLPDTYEIAQIVITIRTIVSGLAYLGTFAFGANATGLFFLGINTTIKMITGKVDEEEEAPADANVEKEMDDRDYITTVEAYLAKKDREAAEAANPSKPSKAAPKPSTPSRPIVINRYDDTVTESSIDNPKL